MKRHWIVFTVNDLNVISSWSKLHQDNVEFATSTKNKLSNKKNMLAGKQEYWLLNLKKIRPNNRSDTHERYFWMVRVSLRSAKVGRQITFPKLCCSFISPLLNALKTKILKFKARITPRPAEIWNQWLKVQLTSICSGVHESRFTDFTLDICTPKFRCIPAQRMHRKTPRFHEAHRGPKQEV